MIFSERLDPLSVKGRIRWWPRSLNFEPRLVSHFPSPLFRGEERNQDRGTESQYLLKIEGVATRNIRR